MSEIKEVSIGPQRPDRKSGIGKVWYGLASLAIGAGITFTIMDARNKNLESNLVDLEAKAQILERALSTYEFLMVNDVEANLGEDNKLTLTLPTGYKVPKHGLVFVRSNLRVVGSEGLAPSTFYFPIGPSKLSTLSDTSIPPPPYSKDKPQDNK